MSDKSFNSKKNVDNAKTMLKKVISILNKYDIKYYLDFGTLIGSVREGGFIPWDNDMDISILDSQDIKKMPIVLKEIKKCHNYRTYLTTFEQARKNRIKNKREIFYDKIPFAKDSDYQIAKVRSNKFWKFGRGKTRLDIFFKYEKDNYIYWFADGRINKIDKKYFVKDLVKIKFYDMECYIPSNYDEYLTQIYGKWKMPDNKWNHNNNLTLLDV